jgi:hypothetical protein
MAACAGYDGSLWSSTNTLHPVGIWRDFEFKNPKSAKIIAFPAVSNYGAVSFAAADWIKNVETRLAAA